MIDHKRTAFGEFLTKNHILYPGLFPNQGLKSNYDREYTWNLIQDMLYYGFDLDAFTETEGGRWLPGAYLHALRNTDSIERWATNTGPLISLWSLTKVHSIRFIDPAKNVICRDNINGIRSTSPGLKSIMISNHRKFKQHNSGGRFSMNHLIINSDRDDELEVGYIVESYGCSSNGFDDPGEAAEVTIWRVVVDIEGVRVELDINNKKLTSFYERVEEKVLEHVHESSFDSHEDDYL